MVGERKHFIGVSFIKASSNYLGRFFWNGKTYSCGRFSNELEAAQSMNAKCVELGIPLKHPEIGLPQNKPRVNIILQTIGRSKGGKDFP